MAREVEQDMRDEECLVAGRYPERYPSQQELLDRVETLEASEEKFQLALEQASQYFWAVKSMGVSPSPERWEDLHKSDRDDLLKGKPEFGEWLKNNPRNGGGQR